LIEIWGLCAMKGKRGSEAHQTLYRIIHVMGQFGESILGFSHKFFMKVA